MHVFGYGSLLWKVDFPYERKILGCIKGYDRRFYQLSTHHRGTPENPGRVVTLIPSEEESKVYGIAYEINEDNVDEVLSKLDLRESGGYERMEVLFYPIESGCKPFPIIVYLATKTNRQYAGPADVETIAHQIIKSSGPSGSNIEYVCNLADAMRDTYPEINDEHLFNIEQAVMTFLN